MSKDHWGTFQGFRMGPWGSKITILMTTVGPIRQALENTMNLNETDVID